MIELFDFSFKNLIIYSWETLSFNPFFSPFYIGDGRIAGSMAVYTTPP